MVSINYKFIRIVLISAFVWNVLTSPDVEDHPRYTAARLADKWQQILERKVSLADSKLFEDDVHLDECGILGGYNDLAEKLKVLVPEISSAQITVKFAYPVPFVNNSIEFTIDQKLNLRDGIVNKTEQAMFARMKNPEAGDDYQIYEVRQTSC